MLCARRLFGVPDQNHGLVPLPMADMPRPAQEGRYSATFATRGHLHAQLASLGGPRRVPDAKDQRHRHEGLEIRPDVDDLAVFRQEEVDGSG